MAVVTGFLRQTCTWTPASDTLDDFGQPVAGTAQTIKCRWTKNAGFTNGTMGEGTGSVSLAYRNVVLIDGLKNNVKEGDTLMYNGEGGKVIAINQLLMPNGKEAGRKCYV